MWLGWPVSDLKVSRFCGHDVFSSQQETRAGQWSPKNTSVCMHPAGKSQICRFIDSISWRYNYQPGPKTHICTRMHSSAFTYREINICRQLATRQHVASVRRGWSHIGMHTFRAPGQTGTAQMRKDSRGQEGTPSINYWKSPRNACVLLKKEIIVVKSWLVVMWFHLSNICKSREPAMCKWTDHHCKKGEAK